MLGPLATEFVRNLCREDATPIQLALTIEPELTSALAAARRAFEQIIRVAAGRPLNGAFPRQQISVFVRGKLCVQLADETYARARSSAPV